MYAHAELIRMPRSIGSCLGLGAGSLLGQMSTYLIGVLFWQSSQTSRYSTGSNRSILWYGLKDSGGEAYAAKTFPLTLQLERRRPCLLVTCCAEMTKTSFELTTSQRRKRRKPSVVPRAHPRTLKLELMTGTHGGR